MTPEQFVIQYAKGHAADFGIPAPLTEVVANVFLRSGMSPKQATELVMGMETSGLITIDDKSGEPTVSVVGE